MEAAKSSYDNRFSGGVSIGRMPVLNTHAGTVRWVDSNGGSNGDGSFKRSYATIDATVGLCAANKGDIIMVKPGHVETVSAAAGLDLDVAGISVVFLGNGNDRGRVNFTTDVGADMDVDAADITLVNARFTAGIDALTGPIDVNSARFRMFGATWEDGTTINTTDCLVADANADDMIIDGFTFIDGDAAGTQKQSFIQVAGATRPTIKNIRCTGDFDTGIIENGTAWVDATLENLVLDNAAPGPVVCVLLQATSSGWFRNSSLRVASGTPPVGYTAGTDMQFDNVNVVGTDAAEAQSAVIGGLADSAASGAVTTTDTIMAYIKQLVTELQVVDEFHDVPAANNTLNAQINEVIGNKTDAAAAGAVTTTDTLVGYIKQLVTQMGVEADTDPVSAILSGTGGITTWKDGAAPATGISLSEVIRAIYNAVAADGAAGSTVVQPGLGKRVTKVGDISAAPDDLFTVTGKCLITCMVGEVTSVLATTQSLAIVTSTNNQTIAAASTVTSDDVGTLYIVSGDPDLALNGGGTPGLDAATLTNGSLAPFMVNEDKIHQSINGAGTGLIQWDLWYIPLEDSASIASSA